MKDENENIETGEEAMDEISRLERLSKGLNKTQIIVTPNAPKATDVIAKDDAVEEHPRLSKDFQTGSLQKSFQTLARSCKEFRHLEANKAMDNPQLFLRDTYVDMGGRRKFVVSDMDLENMINVLLLEGSYHTNVKQDERHGEYVNNWNPEQSKSIAQGFSKGLRAGAFGGRQETDVLAKSLDTTGGSGGPLIRTDVDPMLREAYLRKFPLGDAVRRIPANGLVHTYDQRTAPGTAAFLTELGSLSATASDSTYIRSANSNIGVIGAQRQVSLKLQYAVAQSGMSFDLTGAGNLEVIGALTAIALVNQAAIAQGNFTDGGKTLDDEEGLTNTAAYDGLRTILKSAGTSVTKSVGESYMDAINRAVIGVLNAGGDVNSLTVLMSLGARFAIDQELINFYRIMNSTPAGGIATNLGSNGIMTVADTLTRFMPIPAATQGSGMGYYTLAGTVTEDLDVIDASNIALAYLGSPTPSVLELPVGYNNALSNVYIPFLMNGLCVFTTSFHRKVRIPRVIV